VISRIVALVIAAEVTALAIAAEKEQPIEVYFSPGVSCTEAIVRELINATQQSRASHSRFCCGV